MIRLLGQPRRTHRRAARIVVVATAVALTLTACEVPQRDDTVEVDTDHLPNCDAVNTLESPETEDRLPDLTLSCLGQGRDINLRGVDGPAIVNVWASWCPQCRAEMPLLQQAHAAYGGEIQVLGVNTRDFVEPAVSLLTERDMNYPHVIDTDDQVLPELRFPGVPVTIAVDEHGSISEIHTGQLDGNALDNLIELVVPAKGASP